MKKYSIIANCQGIKLNAFLNSNKYFRENYKLIHLKPIQKVTKIEIDNFYKTIHQIDLIIIQPISDNYKNYHRYSTSSILKNIKKECVVIMFPSMYFTGYYPNVIHHNISSINIRVHDENIIKIFIDSKNKERFVKRCIYMINNRHFYSKEYINKNIKDSINNLLERELKAKKDYNPKFFIKISTFISNNYMKNILFTSFNHLTKYTYRYLSDEILRVLHINITPYPEELQGQENSESCILYKSVKNVINKDLIKNKYSQRGLADVHLKQFLEFHYDKYSLVKKYLINNFS